MTQSTRTAYDYMGKYARTIDSWEHRTSPDTVDLARKAIEAIRNGEETSLLMLESINSLPAHPESLYLLNDPSLVQASILRLFRLQRQDNSYPFGYEDGYLLFRIIILSIGMILNSRNTLMLAFFMDWTVRYRETFDDLSANVLISASDAVDKVAYAPRSSSDAFFGWSYQDSNQPLVSRPNVLTLLDILWRDRVFPVDSKGHATESQKARASDGYTLPVYSTDITL
ncbi:hypothetical protein FRC12_019828 [Ceratobasidium sp. 428]|nr:hypothetical protein FRC12_019828 [Ceratobasidium sp. 428]